MGEVDTLDKIEEQTLFRRASQITVMAQNENGLVTQAEEVTTLET